MGEAVVGTERVRRSGPQRIDPACGGVEAAHLRAPTWPWRPGTLNTFITLLAAPVVLFVVTRLLERFF